MSKDQMSESIRETWRLIQQWRLQNDSRTPKAKDIKEWRPDISLSRLNDHFTWLRRHRFIQSNETRVSYQASKKYRQKQQYQALERIAQELRRKGHG